jgi:hypothetical protein
MSFLVNLCARVASLRHLLEPASDWLAWDREASRLLPSRHEMCGAGLLFLRNRAGIFKLLRSPGIDSMEYLPPAYVCSLAGRYGNPIPSRFLAPIDRSKIPAQNICCNRRLTPQIRKST